MLTHGTPLPYLVSASAAKQIVAYVVDQVGSARETLKVRQLQAQMSGDGSELDLGNAKFAS